jgi:hypothetical protein
MMALKNRGLRLRLKKKYFFSLQDGDFAVAV